MALTMASLPVAAQEAVDAVIACRAIAEPGARSACFEETTTALAAWRNAQTQTPTTQASPTERSEAPNAPAADNNRRMRIIPAVPSFGLRREEGSAPVQAVAARAQAVARDDLGRIIAVLDNGQVWRTFSGGRYQPLQEGAAVIISESGYGGFRLRVDGHNRDLDVERLR
jgi:hypothetical protein